MEGMEEAAHHLHCKIIIYFLARMTNMNWSLWYILRDFTTHMRQKDPKFQTSLGYINSL